MEHRRERLSSPNWEGEEETEICESGQKDTKGMLGWCHHREDSSWSRGQNGAGVGGVGPAFELAHRG